MSAMVEQSPLPSRHAVRTLVEGLVGRDVELIDSDPVPNRPTNVVAVYVTDQLTMSVVAVTTIEGAARLGGALGMLPKAGIEDAIDEKDLSGTIGENCYEVLNVLAAVFNEPGAPHVRLYSMYKPDDALPGDVASMVTLAGSRLDLILEIAGYGDVPLSIVVR